MLTTNAEAGSTSAARRVKDKANDVHTTKRESTAEANGGLEGVTESSVLAEKKDNNDAESFEVLLMEVETVGVLRVMMLLLLLICFLGKEVRENTKDVAEAAIV